MTTLSASTQRRRLRLALLMLAAAWIATEAISVLSERLINGAADETPVPVVAAFTGSVEHGVPVYRLPSLTVTAKRSGVMVEADAPKRVAREPQPSAARSRTPS